MSAVRVFQSVALAQKLATVGVLALRDRTLAQIVVGL